MLYQELANTIMKDVINGKYEIGEKLPSAKKLCELYGVSNSTVREALRVLQNEGIVKSINGIGTFINKRMLKSDLSRLVSTKLLIESSGFEDKISGLKIYEHGAKEEWEEKLEGSSPFIIIERVRSTDECNLVKTINVLRKEVVGDIFEGGFDGSLLDYLQSALDIRIVYSISEIKVPAHDNQIDIDANNILGGKALLLDQVHYDEHDNPIFISIDYMNNEKMRFFIRRERF